MNICCENDVKQDPSFSKMHSCVPGFAMFVPIEERPKLVSHSKKPITHCVFMREEVKMSPCHDSGGGGILVNDLWHIVSDSKGKHGLRNIRF